ncbi:MAG: thymidylate synthase, partial [Gammaproteobacteria bacterium]|nr:thymidylate synthase [Gammaproteobacteria bacterium]
MSNYETEYLALAQKILDEGEYTEDRTGTGTYSLVGAMIRHDLSKSFPILTSKKINPTLPIGEMLWMLAGKTDLPSLRKYQNKPKGSHTIWSDDFEKFWERTPLNQQSHIEAQTGGNIYGKQLRNFSHGLGQTHDQLKTLIDNIMAVKENPSHPMGRRLRCSFWNPFDHTIGAKHLCALPACHV